MSQPIKHFYDFDRFRIDVIERVLLSDGEIVPLTQKAFDVLLVLVERQGQIVEKEELMQKVWPDTFVEEGNLSQNIYTLRKVLGETLDRQEFIKTVPKRGYRFGPNVTEQQIIGSNLDSTGNFQDEVKADSELSSDQNPSSTLRSVVVQFPTDNRPISHKTIQPADSHQTSWISQHKVLAATLAVTLLLGSLSSLVWLAKSSEWDLISPGATSKMTITNLTTTGNISCAAVSPDGKYVAYGMTESAERGSLWLIQLATMTSQQIIPPVEHQYHALTFSRDSQFVYFVTNEGNSIRRLYRVPLLGGTKKKLLDKIDSPVSFSPDGSQFVFRQVNNERREVILLTANADGQNVREIAATKIPDNFGDPVWSPNGELIACSEGNPGGQGNMYVAAVRVKDGAVKPVTAKRWQWVGQMGWLADSSGLMMVATESASTPYQIWRLDYRSGQARRITNDSNFYNRLSFATDSNILIALQRKQLTNVWLIPREAPNNAQQITFGAGGYRGHISWAPDGKIVYDSEAINSPTISVMNADGSLQKQLVSELITQSHVGHAVVSPDGRFIAISSDYAGTRHIWRINPDGSNPIQLTNGKGEDNPNFSPDGRWVVYTKLEETGSGRPTLWRVSIDGGQATQLTSEFTASPAVSPDGKMIACMYAEVDQPWQLAIYPFDGGKPIKIYPQKLQGNAYVRWTTDGKNLTYAENPIGPSRLWLQPVEGGAPRLLSEFTSDRIFGFDWSRDGKYLACVRGLWTMNVVLIKDFQ